MPCYDYATGCLKAVAAQPVFRCGCGKCGFEVFCKRGCLFPFSGPVFPYLDFEGLDEADRDLLIGKLEEDAEVLRSSFNGLCVQLMNWANDLPFSKLISMCKTFDGYESKRGTHPMLEDRSKDIDDCSTSDDTFKILADYYSWYSFMILDEIVSHFSREEDKITALLRNYKEKFNDYCKRSIFECPQVFSSVPRKGKVLLLKSCIPSKCSFINSFLRKLARALNIHPHTLKLVSVNTGCILLVLSLPSAVAKKAFPLTSSQEMELVSLSVQKLFCLDFYFNASVSECLQVGL